MVAPMSFLSWITMQVEWGGGRVFGVRALYLEDKKNDDDPIHSGVPGMADKESLWGFFQSKQLVSDSYLGFTQEIHKYQSPKGH